MTKWWHEFWQRMQFVCFHWHHIMRIVSVVQDNKEFFNGKCGDSCLERAATKLEELTANYKSWKEILDEKL